MLHAIPSALLSALLTVPAPAQQPAEGAAALQKQGIALLMDKKDFDGAIAALSKAIELDERVARTQDRFNSRKAHHSQVPFVRLCWPLV
jgi:hypothetical protein